MTSSYMEPDHVKKSADIPGLPPVDPMHVGPPPSYSNQPGPSAYPPNGQPPMQSAYPQPYQQQGAWTEPPPPSTYPPPPGPPMGYGYGAPPPPPQQQQQQVVVIGGPGPTAAVPIIHVETFVGQIVLSCFVFWFCNWLFGLIAFVLAMVAGSSAVNDPKGARSLGKASYGVSIAGIIITVLLIIIVVAVVVTRTAQAVNTASSLYSSSSSLSSSSSSTCSSFYYYYNSVCYMWHSTSLSKTSCNALNGYYSSINGCYYGAI